MALQNIIRIKRNDYNTIVGSGSITKDGVTYTYSPTTTVYLVDNGLNDTYVQLGGGER